MTTKRGCKLALMSTRSPRFERGRRGARAHRDVLARPIDDIGDRQRRLRGGFAVLRHNNGFDRSVRDQLFEREGDDRRIRRREPRAAGGGATPVVYVEVQPHPETVSHGLLGVYPGGVGRVEPPSDFLGIEPVDLDARGGLEAALRGFFASATAAAVAATPGRSGGPPPAVDELVASLGRPGLDVGGDVATPAAPVPAGLRAEASRVPRTGAAVVGGAVAPDIVPITGSVVQVLAAADRSRALTASPPAGLVAGA